MTEFPRGDKTPRVTTKGTSAPREYGQGQGGDEPLPTTQATGAQGNGGRDNEPIGGPRTAEPPRPQRGTAADNGIAETPPRHTAVTSGTSGARPEHGTLARRKYDLLAPEEPAGNLAAAEPQDSEYSPEETIGKRVPDRKETDMGE